MESDEELRESWLDVTDVEALRRVWRNEKLAPEILQFEADVVDRVREQTKLAEDNIMALAADMTDELTLSLYRMDMNRAQFLLRSYVRTRLEKIQRYAFHTVVNMDVWTKLSEMEQEYAKRHVDLTERHMKESILDKLPENYKNLHQQASSTPEYDMIVEPVLDTFVICKCKNPVGNLQLDDKGEEIVDLTAGALNILPYRPVKRLIETDQVELH